MFDPKLLLPEFIYALPGFEINIYFQNIVTVINIDNYAFDVECAKGRCDQQRWRWIPADEDVGRHQLKLSVWSDEGLLASAETVIIVSPRNAGAGKTLNILHIGASCTVGIGHCEQLYNRFQLPGNPQVVMLGSHGSGYQKLTPGMPASEGYGGWNWDTFFLREKPLNQNNDGLHPQRPNAGASPFIFDKNGKKEFDFKAYLDTVCNGIKPDVVYFELGVNGTFLCKTDEEFEKVWAERNYPFMKRMIDIIHQTLPDAVLGVELIPKGSWSQDAFGENYGCQQSRRRWLVNADLLFRKYMSFAEEMNYMIIPEYINSDGSINYPVKEEPLYANSNIMVTRSANALHASPEGYSQWADSEYFFLKYILAEKYSSVNGSEN